MWTRIVRRANRQVVATKEHGRYMQQACMSTAQAVRYHEFGHPSRVLKMESDKIGKPSANEVALKILAAPINPADFNMIEGQYGIKATLPAVGGNEGVAVITAVGSGVSGLSVNDRVIPTGAGFGTWRTHAISKAENVTKISSEIPVEYAATLAVNPSTAYRMLADFADLKAGDVIVQNGANSSVGQAVIQLAKLRGIKTINVIRNSEDYAETVDHLKGLGGDIVCDADYLASADYRRMVNDLPAPKLGLNCVGGSCATDVARALGKGATMVTYGAMARQPVVIPTSVLIYKNITLKGFWMSEWVKNSSKDERVAMLNELADMIKAGTLNIWVEKYKFEDFDDALAAVTNQRNRRKVVLSMEE